MTRREIEEQAERITNAFSYRNGYSTPRDAYISAVEWTLAHISDWIEQRAKERIPAHGVQNGFEDGFLRGLDVVLDFIDIDYDKD